MKVLETQEVDQAVPGMPTTTTKASVPSRPSRTRIASRPTRRLPTSCAEPGSTRSSAGASRRGWKRTRASWAPAGTVGLRRGRGGHTGAFRPRAATLQYHQSRDTAVTARRRSPFRARSPRGAPAGGSGGSPLALATPLAGLGQQSGISRVAVLVDGDEDPVRRRDVHPLSPASSQRSDSTRTPISMGSARPSSPGPWCARCRRRWTGRNAISSIAAVTAGPPLLPLRDRPGVLSTSRITSPPCTLPSSSRGSGRRAATTTSARSADEGGWSRGTGFPTRTAR